MHMTTSYSDARANLAKLMDRAVDDKEAVLITRRNGKNVALISAAELSSLEETAYLLRSPENKKRLFRSIRRAEAGKGKPSTVAQLRRDVGL